MSRCMLRVLAVWILAGNWCWFYIGAECPAAELADQLRQLDARVLTDDEREARSDQVNQWIERELLQGIARENTAWEQVDSREAWEAFRNQRVEALRRSLGSQSERQAKLNVHRTGVHERDGFVVENLVYESRPGLWVSANLYRPSPPRESMPAILLSHSHHNPKTESELQTMGITWARQGCVVLVPDHLGHGERRQHPFASSDDYPGEFRRGRQDYYFRYQVNVQLQSIGESLMGWLVHDLRRGIDLLETIEGMDRDRIILIGAVAGGGDPAGVTAALDERIDCVIPFNFGGPQPDYAIPADAENTFYYFGVAYWEQTRCLPRGGRDGFAHWLIAAAAAPRGLVYSCEFSWDRERDPVWPRIEKVYSLYDARDRLATAMGRGNLKGQPPESSHCNNVGAVHRQAFYPHLERWFRMPIPSTDAQPAFSAEDLTCLTPEIRQQLDPQPVHGLVRQMADSEMATARAQLQSQSMAQQRESLRNAWAKLLGLEATLEPAKVLLQEAADEDSLHLERVLLETSDQIAVPLLMLRSKQHNQANRPLVVMLARGGKQSLLKERAEEIAALLKSGAIVCLPDVREMGETAAGSDLTRGSRATSLSCRAQVLGHTMLGGRLTDLRSVLNYLHSRDDLRGPLAVWGESLAAANAPSQREAVPEGIDNPNTIGQPGAGLLALLAGLYDERVAAVVSRGCYDSFASLLDSQFLYVPHDAVVSGAPTTGDLSDLAAALGPAPVLRQRSINGSNRAVETGKEVDAAAWLIEKLSQIER